MALTMDLPSWQPVVKPDSPLFHCPQCDQVNLQQICFASENLNLLYEGIPTEKQLLCTPPSSPPQHEGDLSPLWKSFQEAEAPH